MAGIYWPDHNILLLEIVNPLWISGLPAPFGTTLCRWLPRSFAALTYGRQIDKNGCFTREIRMMCGLGRDGTIKG